MAEANHLIKIGNSIMIGFYVVLFAVAVHNTTRYVLRDARGKNFHITYFYVMVYLIISVRVTWLSLILNTVRNYKEDRQENYRSREN